ncbi:MAG: efflux RND transporter periplasmic adaptor subunit [Phycisphaerales bacterium]
MAIRTCRAARRAIRPAIVPLALFLLLSSCGQQRPEYTPPGPPEVTVAHPVFRAIPDTLEFTATIRGAREVDIRSRVEGYLLVKHADGGIRVEENAELFTLDARPFAAAVREGEAVVLQREAELAQAEVELAAERDAMQRGGSNQLQINNAVAARDVAAALLSLAEAQLVRARLDEEWAVVRAPFGGRMSFSSVEEGDLISANQPLARIIEDSVVYAVYDIDERTLLELREKYNNLRPGEDGRPNLVVRLGRANDRGYPYVGRFYRAEAGVNPDTGTIRVEAEFDNPDGAILPGTFVRVQPVFGDRDAVLIPDLAVQADQQGRYVLVVDQDNVARRVAVRVNGPVYERMRPVQEIIGESLNGDPPPTPRLTPDARVIVSGLQRVRDGTPVDAAFEGERNQGEQEPPGGAAAPGH